MSEERRRQACLVVTIPVRVAGVGADGQHWTEMSTVKDTSAGGVAFTLKQMVTRGHVLNLSRPLPKRFRSYDPGEASYHVHGLVRSAQPEPQGFRVGVMFLGKNPPRGYEKEPSGLYLLPDDPAPVKNRERRRHTRLDVFVNVTLLRREEPAGPREERTIAENIGRGGARVLTSLAVAPGEVLVLREVDGDFATRVAVRSVYVGPDQVPRLNLQFLDGQAPDRLVSTR